MKLLHRLNFLLACLALSGCMGMSSGSKSTQDPAMVPTSDVMRAGDKVTIRLTGVPGEDGYIIELQIPPGGDISVPLLSQSFHASGRPAGDLAAELTQAYKTEKIYSTPEVTVIPEERYVNVGGDVRSPTRVIYTPDLTLLSAINSCGGFTDYAKRNTVRILRGQQVIYVDATAASSHPGEDPPLLPGDQVFVPKTMF